MRDGAATGQGSLIVAGVAGYAVGNLHIPGYELPWEERFSLLFQWSIPRISGAIQVSIPNDFHRTYIEFECVV